MVRWHKSIRQVAFSALFFVVSVMGVMAAPAAGAAAASLAPTRVAAAACANITDSSKVPANGSAPGNEGTKCLFSNYVNPIVKLLAGAVGVVVIFSLVRGAIEYQTSAGDSGKVARAKGHIYQAIFALIAFLFLIAMLQWVLPGGIKGSSL